MGPKLSFDRNDNVSLTVQPIPNLPFNVGPSVNLKSGNVGVTGGVGRQLGAFGRVGANVNYTFGDQTVSTDSSFSSSIVNAGVGTSYNKRSKKCTTNADCSFPGPGVKLGGSYSRDDGLVVRGGVVRGGERGEIGVGAGYGFKNNEIKGDISLSDHSNKLSLGLKRNWEGTSVRGAVGRDLSCGEVDVHAEYNITEGGVTDVGTSLKAAIPLDEKQNDNTHRKLTLEMSREYRKEGAHFKASGGYSGRKNDAKLGMRYGTDGAMVSADYGRICKNDRKINVEGGYDLSRKAVSAAGRYNDGKQTVALGGTFGKDDAKVNWEYERALTNDNDDSAKCKKFKSAARVKGEVDIKEKCGHVRGGYTERHQEVMLDYEHSQNSKKITGGYRRRFSKDDDVQGRGQEKKDQDESDKSQSELHVEGALDIQQASGHIIGGYTDKRQDAKLGIKHNEGKSTCLGGYTRRLSNDRTAEIEAEIGLSSRILSASGEKCTAQQTDAHVDDTHTMKHSQTDKTSAGVGQGYNIDGRMHGRYSGRETSWSVGGGYRKEAFDVSGVYSRHLDTTRDVSITGRMDTKRGEGSCHERRPYTCKLEGTFKDAENTASLSGTYNADDDLHLRGSVFFKQENREVDCSGAYERKERRVKFDLGYSDENGRESRKTKTFDMDSRRLGEEETESCGDTQAGVAQKDFAFEPR